LRATRLVGGPVARLPELLAGRDVVLRRVVLAGEPLSGLLSVFGGSRVVAGRGEAGATGPDVAGAAGLDVGGDVRPGLVRDIHVAGPATRCALVSCTRLIGHGSSLSSGITGQ
jgi:hypothetical protein